MKNKVKRLDQDAAILFLENNFKSLKIDYKSKVFIASMSENEVSSIAIFSSPAEIKDKKNHTIELVLFESLTQKNKEKDFNLIVDYFKKKSDTSDIILNSNNIIISKSTFLKNFVKQPQNKWSWFNPNYTFYTYKITSLDSNKYYYGVRRINKAEATIDDCLKDDYYGSGRKNDKTNKFSNWKSKYHKSLQKEIIEIFKTKVEAYSAEKILIDDLWATDKDCLNSCAGGSHGGIGLSAARIDIRHCEIHGEVKHIGSSCYSCTTESKNSEKICEIHGLSKFRGESCYSCSKDSNVLKKICLTHGEVKHYGDKCCKCHTESSVKLKLCKTHGKSKHIGEKCYKCISSKANQKGSCKIHGETKFRGDSCCSCLMFSLIKEGFCEIHGETKYRKGACLKCQASSRFSLKECSKHGLVKHSGDSCKTCSAYKIAHNRFHKNGKTKEDCEYCQKS